MILVSTGTHYLPFNRLLKMINGVMKELKEPVVIQSGTTKIKVKGARQVEMLDYSEFIKLVRKVRVVVCQAGPAVISQVWESDKKPVVVPRLKKYGEHVSDHQLDYAEQLSKEGKIWLVKGTDELREALMSKQRVVVKRSKFERDKLVKKLKEYLNDQ